jgi:ferritin-like metal-binding protein YciE
MDENSKKVAKLLAEAHSNELALVTVLQAHERIAESGNYKKRLRSHLSETRSHADRVGRRLDQLGYQRRPLAQAYGLAQTAVRQGLVMLKGPVDFVRGGTDRKEKMVRNAIDEAMTEGLEIAAYDTIETLARTVGDEETADLAADIREDELRMFDALRAEIPALVVAMAVASNGGSEVTPEEPWAGYDDMTVEQIEKELQDASPGLLIAVRNYEKANKNRSTVITATEREPIESS